MKLFFYRERDSLRPCDEAGESVLRKLTTGECVEIEFRKPRNIRFHRLYWKLCSIVAENMPVTCSAEAISDILKLRTGHTVKFTINGKLYEVPDSISFAAMDDVSFGEFFNRATKVVEEELIPGLDSESLNREVYQLIGT